MNILFLGGAKRVSMARFFKRAGAQLGLKVEIYSYELSKHVPITIEAKVIEGKKWTDPDIYNHLHEVCLQYGISIVVPFVDGAVAVAAEMSTRYPDDIFAPTCTAERAEEMFDKVRAAEIFASHGLSIPRAYDGVIANLIAKPRHGSASKGLIKIDNDQNLTEALAATGDYLIQERIDHREEYTVDCYVNVHTGRLQALVPRLRIEVSGGEVTHTATVIRPEVTDLARQALEKLGLRGAVTVQIIRDIDTDRYMLMEINPRLGGGAVCAVLAEVDIPGMIISDSQGHDTEYACYRPYTEVVRYQQEVTYYN